MDKDKILRLCNEIENIATEIKERTMKDSYFMAQTIIEKVLEISVDISEPPKTNGDNIRQMTDEEIAEMLLLSTCYFRCDKCKYYNNCIGKSCTEAALEWLKQEVGDDA